MKIFAIADTHLSFNPDGTTYKPMDIFGPSWENHWEKLKKNWIEEVGEDDYVIVAGDVSWALKPEEAKPDLDFLKSLPGKKIFFKGNHDLWWTSHRTLDLFYGEEIEVNDNPGTPVKKVVPCESMRFIQNEAFMIGALAICGTRGWDCPGREDFTEHDLKVYEREVGRLKMSLEDAVKKGAKEIIGVLHYPPTNENQQGSGFTDLMTEYGVKTCVYGHLHGKDNYKRGIKGIYNSVDYKLVSLDYVEAKPVLLKEI